jgi:hypothetical protein
METNALIPNSENAMISAARRFLGWEGTWTDHEQDSISRQKQTLFSLAIMKACMVSN